MDIYVATHNAHKLREIGEILPGFTVHADDPDAEETAPDFAGNALIKARAIAARHIGCWVMADDSGLEVDALNGAPGVYSARYSETANHQLPTTNCQMSISQRNNALLLRNLEGVADRRAHFTCCVALIDPQGAEHIVEGRCFGKIAHEASGEGGFGYDPLFIPDGRKNSFAELSAEEKNAISHRGRALAKVKELLEAQRSTAAV